MPNKPTPTHDVVVAFPKDLHREIRRLGQRDLRSTRAQIVYAVQQYVDGERAKEEAA